MTARRNKNRERCNRPIAGPDRLLRYDDGGTGRWNSRYPMIRRSKAWSEIAESFYYPDDIRRAIYTTNAIESLNFCLWKLPGNKSSFLNDDSI